MTEKPNCYNCIHRGGVPGSAHSSCNHPAFTEVKKKVEGSMLGLAMALSGGHAPPIYIEEVKVKGNEYGIQSGWFNHPFNFDPVWLEECSGYTPREKKGEEL